MLCHPVLWSDNIWNFNSMKSHAFMASCFRIEVSLLHASRSWVNLLHFVSTTHSLLSHAMSYPCECMSRLSDLFSAIGPASRQCLCFHPLLLDTTIKLTKFESWSVQRDRNKRSGWWVPVISDKLLGSSLIRYLAWKSGYSEILTGKFRYSVRSLPWPPLPISLPLPHNAVPPKDT